MAYRVVAASIVVIAASGVARPGSPSLAAQAPAGARAYTPARTPSGHPDLQGVWRVWNLAKYDLEDHGAKPGVPAGRGVVVDPPDGRIPYLPSALEKRRSNYEGTRTFDPAKHADPLAKCYLPGILRLTYLGWPFQIIQTPEYVLFNYEWSHKKRSVPINGKAPLPNPDDESNWNGMARGRYEGNALVVDVTNFNPYTWFDMAGNFHSEALKVVERYTPIDADTLQYDVRIEDAKVFTRPWAIRMLIQRQKDIGILDYECTAMLDEQGIHHTWPRDFDVVDIN